MNDPTRQEEDEAEERARHRPPADPYELDRAQDRYERQHGL